MEIKDKALRYLGLAMRAGRVATGYNTCLFTIKKNRIKLLLLAEDLAENSRKKMSSAAEAAGVPCITYGSMEELSNAAGKENSGIFGITDENLAKAILTEIDHKQSMKEEVF